MREAIALTIDSSAIVLVAMGFWLGFQRRSGLGVAFGVLGLAVMAASLASRAYPNPTPAALQEKAQALGAELAQLRAELAATIEKWRKAQDAAQAFEQEATRLRQQLVALNEKLAGETEAKLQLAKEVEKLSNELLQARREKAEARTGMHLLLKSMMSAGPSTKLYRIAVLPERELIVGKIGIYFSVRLQDETGAQFVFPKGRYSIPASEAAIRNATDRVVADLLQALKGEANYELFVRGGADAEPFTGTEDLPAALSTVAYRARTDGGKYAADLTEQTFRMPLSNADLPILRAAYVRSLIRDRLAPLGLDVLHNMPSEGGDRERTVELIVYVKW